MCKSSRWPEGASRQQEQGIFHYWKPYCKCRTRRGEELRILYQSSYRGRRRRKKNGGTENSVSKNGVTENYVSKYGGTENYVSKYGGTKNYVSKYGGTKNYVSIKVWGN